MKRSAKFVLAAVMLSFVGSALSACVVVPEREVHYYREPPPHYYHWR
jgi:nucleoside permease NupC